RHLWQATTPAGARLDGPDGSTAPPQTTRPPTRQNPDPTTTANPVAVPPPEWRLPRDQHRRPERHLQREQLLRHPRLGHYRFEQKAGRHCLPQEQVLGLRPRSARIRGSRPRGLTAAGAPPGPPVRACLHLPLMGNWAGPALLHLPV